METVPAKLCAGHMTEGVHTRRMDSAYEILADAGLAWCDATVRA